MYLSFLTLLQDSDTHTPTGHPRTRIVVLGSGWGAISFLRNLDPKMTSGMVTSVAHLATEDSGSDMLYIALS